MEYINLVLNTFGLYSCKTLERLTYKETPWLNAREGYGEDVASTETIEKEDIYAYFESLANAYDLSDEGEILKYISNQLNDEYGL